MSVPIIKFHHGPAVMAFEAHQALVMAEASYPKLKNNPFWTLLRQDAFERFANEYEVEGE